MADNSQAIAAALAEAEQRVQQLRAQLQQAQSSNPVAAKYAAQKAPVQPKHMQDLQNWATPAARMANVMGREAQGAEQFNAGMRQDLTMQQAGADRTRQLLRMKMQQLANPGMSPMQMDLQRRMPPTVTPQATQQWQQAQAGTPGEDWNDPWKYSGG